VAVVLALAACVRQGAPAPVVHSSSGVAASPAQGAVIGMPRAVQAPADGQIVVRSGESLYVVAQRAGVPVRALIDANDLRPPYAVSNGQRLTVPRQATHQVQAGDTLAGIARRYGFGTNELVRANAMTAPYAVQVGQVLTLPGAAGPVVAGVTPNPASSLATPPPSPVASAVTPPPAAIERAPRGAVESTILPPPSPVAAAPAAEPAPTPVAILPTPAPVLNPAAIQPASLPVPQTLAPPEPDNEPSLRPGRGFLWPVRGGSVISDYGAKPGGLQNDGINISAPRGSAIRAAEAGSVVYAGNELRGFGNLLLIRHKDGWITAYAHADELMVKRGDEVMRGQTIARVGSTGGVSTPQLHFEIRRGSRPLNPRDYLAPQAASATP
jgi:murein DD-endopeptidase MepM/ murein hydrolase activator NlpD